MLTKRSAILPVLAAGGSSYVGSKILKDLQNRNRIDIRKSLQDISPVDVAQLSQKFKTPIRTIPEFDNAFFVKPGPMSTEEETSIRKHMKRSPRPQREALGSVLELSKTPKGGVVIGERVTDPTIIAHEVGHSLDRSTLSGVAPTIENIWRKYKLPFLGTAGAIAIGELFPKYRNVATLANLGVQAASAVPVLHSEYKASQKAKEIYPEAKKELLDKTFGSYLLSTLGERVGIPATAHLGQYMAHKMLGT